MRGTTIIGASIKAIDSEGLEVVGGSVEFKREAVHQKSNDSQEVLQTVANMIRVAGYLVGKALKKGKLIEEVKIYGLLMSHTNPHCVPFMYQSNCLSKSTVVHRGDKILLNEALVTLLAHI